MGDIVTLCRLELETKVREDFTIMETAPTRAFSLLKAPTKIITYRQLWIRPY